MTTTPAIGGVVVLFYPDASVLLRLERMRLEVTKLVLIDNGATDEMRSTLRAWAAASDAALVSNAHNCGLSAALNQGIRWSLEQDFKWAVLFDQDSTPQPGMVTALWRTRQNYGQPQQVAVVGPRLQEEKTSGEVYRWVMPSARSSWWFRRVPCVDRDLSGVAFVITSGSLVNLTIFDRVGPMDDSLFIDYIDHDYCLRARRLGFEILVSVEAALIHNLGAKQEFTVAGKTVRPTFHSPLRLRYRFRNLWIVWRRHAWHFRYWAAFDLIYSHYNLLRILAFEDARWQKLVAVLRGSWDGLCGKSGEIK